jgi:hypothetical protein
MRCLTAIAVGFGMVFGCGNQLISGTITKSNQEVGYFDDSNGLREITVSESDLDGAPYVADINVTIEFAKHSEDEFLPRNVPPISFAEPYLDEIELILYSPQRTPVVLINSSFDDGGDTAFQGAVTFDQSAPDPVNVDQFVLNAGVYRPATNGGNLDDLIGELAVGTWTLSVGDDEDDDGLSFYGYSIELTTAVPEPTTGILVLSASCLCLRRCRARRGRPVAANVS